MKTFALALILSIGCFPALAQKTLEKGHIHYDVELRTDDIDQATAMQMFENSQLDIYFSGEKSRVDMDMGFFKLNVISDLQSGNILMLISGVIGNKALKTTLEELEEQKEEGPELEIEYTKETKTISGYKCKKAILKGSGNDKIYWYTDKIKLNAEGQDLFDTQLPGTPLEMQLIESGFEMIYTATLIEEKITDEESIFSVDIPEGYQEMTMEEFEQMGM